MDDYVAALERVAAAARSIDRVLSESGWSRRAAIQARRELGREYGELWLALDDLRLALDAVGEKAR